MDELEGRRLLNPYRRLMGSDDSFTPTVQPSRMPKPYGF
jgi:hypothetical protein